MKEPMKKLQIIYLFLFSILILSGCSTKQNKEEPIFVDQEQEAPTEELVQKPVDLSHWLIFGNPDDNYKLYKIRTNGTALTKLSDSKYEGINQLTQWIYYIDKKELYASGKLSRIRYDGSEQQTLTSENINEFCVTEDYVFYVLDNNIYRLNLDGTGKTKLISDDDKIYRLVNHEDYIFYNTNKGLYKIHESGKEHVNIIEGYFYQFNVFENKIFYNNDNIYCANLEGIGEKEIFSEYLYDMLVMDNSFYYNKGNYLYKMELESNETEKLYVGGNANHYFVKEDWIYFHSEHRVIKAKKDFSEYTLFFGKGLEVEKDMYIKLSDQVFVKNYDYDQLTHGEHYHKVFKLDGDNIGQKIADLPIEIMETYDNMIYYSNANDKKLYKMNYVSAKPELVLDKKIGTFKIVDAILYYTDMDNDYHLYEYNLINGSINQLTDVPTYNIVINDEVVYFCNLRDNNTLYTLKSKEEIQVVNANVSNYVVLEDHIYYANEDDHGRLYRVHIDGTNNQKLTDYKVEDIFTYNGLVYYVVKNGTNLLYTIENNEATGHFRDVVGAEYVDLKIFDDRLYICYSSDGGLYFTVEKYLGDLEFSNTLSTTIHYQVNGWDYFIYNLNNVIGHLYKYNKQLNEIQLVINKWVSSLKAEGEWLYYSGITNESGYYPYPFIDRIHTKTGEVQEIVLINKANVYEIEYEVSSPNIFYHYEDDNRLWVKNLNTGLTNSMIGDCTSLQTVKDGWIYYLNNESKGKICRISIDGTDKQVLTNQASQYIYSDKDYLYYLSFEEEEDYRGYLFKSSLNSDYQQLIFGEKLSLWDYLLHRDNLYINHYGLNKYSLSNDTLEKIYDQEIEYFYIEGKKLLCSVNEDGNYKTVAVDLK